VELRTSSGDISISRRETEPGFDIRSSESRAYRAPVAGMPADPPDRDRQPGPQAGTSQAAQNWERDADVSLPDVRAIPPSAEQRIDRTSETGGVDSPNLDTTPPDKAPEENPRLAILTSLQEGKITVGEASVLLNALSKQEG
jgi:hypothetical protein